MRGVKGTKTRALNGSTKVRIKQRKLELQSMSDKRVVYGEHVPRINTGPLRTHADIHTFLRKLIRLTVNGEVLTEIVGKTTYTIDVLLKSMKDQKELEELSALRTQLELIQHSGVPAVTHQTIELNGNAMAGEFIPAEHDSQLTNEDTTP